MLLKRIKYHNFRPFIGDQEILLDVVDEDKNVVVLLGDNTHGKSTFVLSFVWCLYGESRFNEKDSILNARVARELKTGETDTAFVEIEFEDDSTQYTIRRTQRFEKLADGNIKNGIDEAEMTRTDKDGVTRRVQKSDISSIVKTILPMDLSTYFFFEGEKDNEINKAELGDAVRTLLGLAAFGNMKFHIYGPHTARNYYSNSVMGMFESMQAGLSSGEVDRILAKKYDLENKLSEYQKEKDIYEVNINDYMQKKDRIEEKLRQAEPSKQLQKNRDELEKFIQKASKDLQKCQSKLVDSFGKKSMHLFIKPLLEPAMARMEAMDVVDKGIRGIDAQALDELLARKKCLCGTELREGSMAYKELMKYYDILPPKAVGTLITELEDSMAESSQNCTDFIKEFDGNYEDILELRNSINEYEKEVAEISKQLAEMEECDIATLEETKRNYARNIRDLTEKKETVIANISAVESDITSINKKFNESKDKSEKSAKYHLYFKYAEEIYNWLNREYGKSEKDMLKRLNKNVSHIFNEMYNGKRQVSIDENYKFIMTYDGGKVDTTGGLRAIQYFSYVGGLVKLAHDVMNERNKTLAKLGEQYPLVLDAAFSHADEKHTKNISKELAKCTSQLIFALMYKDWRYAKEGIDTKVARVYYFEKIDEMEVHIIEKGV